MNLMKGGIGFSPGHTTNLGSKRSELTKAKMRAWIRTDEMKLKLSQSNKGQISWNKNGKMSETTKLKMSLSKKGKIAHNKGKPMSEETKRKMRKPKSEEHKANMRKNKIIK